MFTYKQTHTHMYRAVGTGMASIAQPLVEHDGVDVPAIIAPLHPRVIVIVTWTRTQACFARDECARPMGGDEARPWHYKAASDGPETRNT